MSVSEITQMQLINTKICLSFIKGEIKSNFHIWVLFGQLKKFNWNELR